MRLIVLGPPGAGKGTQISEISKHFNVKSISTGNLLRENIKNDTALGKKAKSYMDAGGLVPTELINALVDDFIRNLAEDEGFILDGYPRNVEQGKNLDKMLETYGMPPLERAVYMHVEEAVIIKRLSNRLTCSSCNAIFHKLDKPPKMEGICDVCGGLLTVRADDKIDAIKNRLVVYETETAPLVDFYTEKGILFEVNGDQDFLTLQQILIQNLSDL